MSCSIYTRVFSFTSFILHIPFSSLTPPNEPLCHHFWALSKKLQRATVRFVKSLRPSVWLSFLLFTWNDLASTGWIFMKYNILWYLEISVQKMHFFKYQARINYLYCCTVHFEDTLSITHQVCINFCTENNAYTNTQSAVTSLIYIYNDIFTILTCNFSKEKYVLPEDDLRMEICKSVLSVLM